MEELVGIGWCTRVVVVGTVLTATIIMRYYRYQVYLVCSFVTRGCGLAPFLLLPSPSFSFIRGKHKMDQRTEITQEMYFYSMFHFNIPWGPYYNWYHSTTALVIQYVISTLLTSCILMAILIRDAKTFIVWWAIFALVAMNLFIGPQ